MKLKIQKRIAADVLKRSPKRIKLNPEQLSDIKEAITKKDIAEQIEEKNIIGKTKKGVSRGRARFTHNQKTKGRRKGVGTRRGGKKARTPSKAEWMKKVRAQRDLLRELRRKNVITNLNYRMLYNKVGGGFFRSRRHIKLYITENKLVNENAQN